MDGATPELETVHEVTEPDVTVEETESDFTRVTETDSMIVQEGSAAKSVESMNDDADLSLNRSTAILDLSSINSSFADKSHADKLVSV